MEHMGIWAWVYFVACIVLATVPWYFIYRRVYDDGLIGRVFLAGIAAIAAIVVLVTLTTDWFYDTGIETALLTCFMAGFLIWHLFRFHFRARRARGTAPCGLKDRLGCPYVDPGSYQARPHVVAAPVAAVAAVPAVLRRS